MQRDLKNDIEGDCGVTEAEYVSEPIINNHASSESIKNDIVSPEYKSNSKSFEMNDNKSQNFNEYLNNKNNPIHRMKI